MKSSINLSDDAIGLADTNCKYGVYGNILNKQIIDPSRIATLGGRLSVKLGDAKIYCNIDNQGVKAYDIKILKANKQNSADDKSMIIKVTDENLLNIHSIINSNVVLQIENPKAQYSYNEITFSITLSSLS